MKKQVIVVCSVMLTVILRVQAFAIETINNADYINSGYHTKVAEAEYAYLKGEKKRAYDTLQKIEKTIPIIGYVTMQWFVELSLFYENYLKAYKYIYKMIDHYGFKISDFEKYKNFKKLKKKKFYNADTLMRIENDFVADTALWQQINEMSEHDQYCRIFWGNECYDTNKNEDDSLCCLYYMEQMIFTDSINYYKLLDIIEKKGYPLSKNIKYSRSQGQDVYWALSTLTIHMADVPSYVEKMKSILLEYIRNGDCYPDILAELIDKNCILYGRPLVYGQLGDEGIYDIQNLDKRRAAIGLPPKKLICEILKLQVMQHPIPPELLKTLPQAIQDSIKNDLNTPCDF